MSNTPNTITKKFKGEVETLISQGVAANQQEIVNKLHWHKTGMSQAMKGTKNVPVAVYRKFADLYGFEVPGQDKPGNDPQTHSDKEKIVTLLEDRVSSAEGELRHIAVMNFAMLRVMRKYVAKIYAKAEGQDLHKVARMIDKETGEIYRSGRKKGSLVDFDI